MAEYIERNFTISLLRERGLASAEKVNPVFANGIFDAVRFLESRTAADVAPVVHSRWKYHKYVEKYECMECGHFVKHGTDRNYCPNCGAKMDKEDHDAK